MQAAPTTSELMPTSQLALTTHLVTELKPEQLKTLSRLGISGGTLRETLRTLRYWLNAPRDQLDRSAQQFRAANRNAIVVIANNGRSIVGWGLAYREPDEDDQMIPTAALFVRPAQRRQGYGWLILKELRTRRHNLHVCPHDDTSCAFFSNYSSASPSLRFHLDYEHTLENYVGRSGAKSS
jgi:GNAT superfamily N-acetyltransferase